METRPYRKAPPRLKSVLLCLLLCLGLLVVTPTQAHATQYQAPSSCTSNIGNDGLVVDSVYCIQQAIASAVYQFVTALEANLQGYQYMAMAMIFAIYGIKLATGGIDEMVKETATLLLRMGWAFILIQYATWLYPIGASAMDELVGWVTNGVSGFGGGGTMSSTCTAGTYPSGVNTYAYGVWHDMDCMIDTILGATTNPADTLTSLSAVIAPSLVSSTLTGIAGLAALIGIAIMLFMLIRALYSVLLSYLTLGILIIFTPLIAPLLFFNTAYCKDVFDRWLGMIMSTIFQPMFILGFLSFAVQIEDTFIDGTISGCTLPTMDSQSPGTMTAMGSGMCSYTQLNMTGSNVTNLLEPGSQRGGSATSTDPQMLSDNGNFTNLTTITNTEKPQVTGANQFNYAAPSIGFPMLTRLKPSPSLQFYESSLAFIIITVILYELMEKIPEMAREITLSVGVGFRNVVDPVTGAAMGALSGASHGAIDGFASGRGPFSGFFGAARGGVSGLIGQRPGIK